MSCRVKDWRYWKVKKKLSTLNLSNRQQNYSFFSLERVVPPIPDLGEKKNRKRCCAITNVFFPLVKLPCHEDKDADVDNTRLRARQQMWCNYGMMYQALKLPHHLHDYRSDRVRKRSGLTKKYPRLSYGGKKKEKKRKKGKKKRGKKARWLWALVKRWRTLISRLRNSMNTMDSMLKNFIIQRFVNERFYLCW